MPTIEKLHKNYDENKEVVVIGISAGEKKSKDKPIKYFKENGFTYIHIPNGDDIAETFKVVAYPTTYIIDRQGEIIDSGVGHNENDYSKWKKIIDRDLISKKHK